ncbi:MAG: 6-bladed beta-propeller, partial [Verrucomicrobia bacterium]|nr:6-bladed beta-propeller [Verrucomicrobiota bacterium]
HGDHFFVAHLGDDWPRDRNCRGFVSVLDRNLRVVSNPGGSPPEYAADGSLRPMCHVGDVFQHPHDVCIGRDGSLYVAQFNSGGTYPLKFERL